VATHASAIPENLYTYSDQCTRGARELQDWVRGVLTPAINAYENGGGTCLVPIDGEVNAAAAAASGTDAEVRRIGRAFQEAGSQGPLPGVGRSPDDLPYRPADGVYKMSDTALAGAVAHQDQLAAGAALADKMTTKYNPDNVDWIIDQLDRHAGDGYFDAGFFNSLSANQIAKLMGRRAECVPQTDDQALANALATGAVSKQTVHNVVTALTWVPSALSNPDRWPVNEAAQVSVLKAIAANRAAARNFTDLISDSDLHQLMQIPKNFPDGQVFTQLFNVLTQAAVTHGNDAAGETAFMNRVSTAMHGMDLTFQPGSAAALLQFVSVGIAGSIEDPGAGKSGHELLEWAKREGAAMDQILAPYLKVISQSNASRDALDAAKKGLAEGALLNILPWGGMVKTGSAVLDNLVIGGMQSWAGSKVDGAFAKSLSIGQGPGDMNALQFAMDATRGPGQLAIWTQLAKHGYLLDQNHKRVVLTPDTPYHSTSVFLTPLQSQLGDLRNNGGNYRLSSDTQIDLGTLINNYDASVSIAKDGSKSLEALGGKAPGS
jgi:hypothetical protein